MKAHFFVTATGKRRLLKLAKLLRDDAKNKEGVKFDLGTWGASSHGATKRNFEMEVGANCNTVACAWGLAAVSGAFKRQGVTFSIRTSTIGIPELVINYGRLKDIAAAAKFFQISEECASSLFMPFSYHYSGTPKGAKGERHVARRIEHLVKTGTIDTYSKTR